MPTTILDGETYEQARHRRFTEEAKVIEKMQQDEISKHVNKFERVPMSGCWLWTASVDKHGFLAKHPPQLSVQDQLRSKK